MMRNVLYRAAAVLALAAAAVTGVTIPSAGAAPAHHAHVQTKAHPEPGDWWW